MTSSLPTKGRHHALLAGFLGWTLDAFDFFVIVFLYDTLSQHFGVSKKAIIFTTTATLALRPVGAFIFGLLADRYGRRIPLMANVIYFSIIELLCGFAPNYTVFLILRALFGIGMGGEWGVGASLAMEAAPTRWRGILSGILQSGYSIGYLLAAVATRFRVARMGLAADVLAGRVAGAAGSLHSDQGAGVGGVAASSRRQHGRSAARGGGELQTVLYLVVLMVFMMFLSHGTQDLYPDFLKEIHKVAPSRVANIAMIYNVGAVIGAVIFGLLSQSLGRRKGMMAALGLCLLVMPFWAFGWNVPVLIAATVFMQMGVQGAWGVIPVHLNELSADAARGLMPGMAYQLGILFAAPTNTIEYALRERFGYQWALAGFEVVTIVALVLLLWRGAEEHSRSFVRAAPPG